MLACHIARDLLPSYIDELLSTETARDVAEHLQDCHDCRLFYEQMKKPMEAVPTERKDKEVNFLKKIKMKTRRIQIGAMILAALLVVAGIFAWVFAIGEPVSSEDVLITTEIQHPTAYDTYLGREWAIHFTLTNGKALLARTKYVTPDSGGAATECIITLSEVQVSSWMHESDNFTMGHHVAADETPPENFTVTVRLKDKDIVYSMKEEGLFEP